MYLPAVHLACSAALMASVVWAQPTQICTESTASTKPTDPEICTEDTAARIAYKFYPMAAPNADVARHFQLLNFQPTTAPASPRPVVIMVSGYSAGDQNGIASSPFSPNLKAATRYDFTYIEITSPLNDGAGNFALEFGNNGIANDENPTPCEESDSRDMVYLRKLFEFIDAHPQHFDADSVYMRGFSQNSMFALYTSVCFPDKVKGLWQGGSGLARTGSTPITPGKQAQCSLSDVLADSNGCCSTAWCTDCKYWPAYPATCAKSDPKRKLISCLMSYVDDPIACGTDYYGFVAYVDEGHDARLLSFPKASPQPRGHQDPTDDWAWVSGCLGISTSCTSECEASFTACTDDFDMCDTKLENRQLRGCVAGCSMTPEMLKKSESPVITLSEGKFGTLTGLTATTTAPRPLCEPRDFGTFTVQSAPPTCRPPSDWAGAPDFSVTPTTSCSAPTGTTPTTGGSTPTGPNQNSNTNTDPNSNTQDDTGSSADDDFNPLWLLLLLLLIPLLLGIVAFCYMRSRRSDATASSTTTTETTTEPAQDTPVQVAPVQATADVEVQDL